MDSGRSKEVRYADELATRIHHGRHIDPAEEGDGRTTQPEAGSTSGR